MAPKPGEYETDHQLSHEQRAVAQTLHPMTVQVADDYTTVVDTERRYVEVSDSFCRLVGYTRAELIGKKYDDLTAPNTNDISTVFRLFIEQGYMHGLWMLVHRTGTRILIRYESWVRPDGYIQSKMELVGAGYESKRRSTRLPLQVPIVITGLEPAHGFREECKTNAVNEHGCGAVVSQHLALGAVVTVELKSSGRSTKAHVVLCVRNGESWLLGVEFDSPENFWGIKDPPPDWS